jgi:hypothetical protein
MTDAKFPRPSAVPSFPAVSPDRGRELEDTGPPNDEDVFTLIVELKSALTNVGELCTKLTTRLSRVQLAMLANEHKANRALDRADELAERLGKVESKLGLAAE